MFKATAAQVRLELVNDEARQRRIALAQVLKECAEVCLDQRIQRRLLGAMPAIEMLIAEALGLSPGVQVVRNGHARQSGQATQAHEADDDPIWCARSAL